MADIPRRTLGRTGFEVTTLGFGAMELRGPPTGPGMSDDDAGRLLNTVLDEGINFIDTSIDYGRSEELIGRFIAHRRSEYVLASKCGCVPGAPQGSTHVHTAENIRAGVEHSLRTLKTDHLDLVQFHRSLSREEFDAEGGTGRGAGAPRRGQGALRRRLRRPAHARRADRHGRVRRVPDSLLGAATRARGRHHSGLRGGHGHHHPRWRRPGRPRRLGGPQLLHGLQRDDARLLGAGPSSTSCSTA